LYRADPDRPELRQIDNQLLANSLHKGDVRRAGVLSGIERQELDDRRAGSASACGMAAVSGA
jgi:hypothetical protein